MVQRRWGARAAVQVAESPFRGGALAGVRQNGDLGFDSARIWVKKHVRSMGNLPSASARGCSGRNGARGGGGGAAAANSPACAFGHLKGATAYENLRKWERRSGCSSPRLESSRKAVQGG